MSVCKEGTRVLGECVTACVSVLGGWVGRNMCGCAR